MDWPDPFGANLPTVTGPQNVSFQINFTVDLFHRLTEYMFIHQSPNIPMCANPTLTSFHSVLTWQVFFWRTKVTGGHKNVFIALACDS